MIKKVKYTDKQNDGVIITFDDDTTFQIPTQKHRYMYTDDLKEWLKDEANEIEAYKTQAELDKEAQDKATQDAKKTKAKELNELTIDINTVFYDAHQEAIGNMAAVVAIATAKFQKAISVGIVKEGDTEPTLMNNAQAYQYVYKDQKVTWKGADNKPHVVQVESLVEASEKAMTAKAVILFKY